MASTRQTVDATAENSDNSADDATSPEKADKSAANKDIIASLASDQPPAQQQHSTACFPRLLAPKPSMNRDDTTYTSGRHHPIAERATKRAEGEVINETERDKCLHQIDQYYLAPPETPPAPARDDTFFQGNSLIPNPGLSGIPLQAPFNNRPCYELEAIPARPAASTYTNTHAPAFPAVNPANRAFQTYNSSNLSRPVSTPINYANTTPEMTNTSQTIIQPNQATTPNATTTRITTSPNPTPTKTPLTLRAKVELTREFASIFHISEHDAHDVLVRNNWNADAAVVERYAAMRRGKAAQQGAGK